MTSAESQTMLEPQTLLEPQTHNQQRRRLQHNRLNWRRQQLVTLVGRVMYIHPYVLALCLHMQITEMTPIMLPRRPQSEWPKASTVGGPVVQVRNKPVLFVLIDNPISQSVMFFFLSLPIAITNGSTWSFSIYQNLLHAGTFRF